jgi:hypothetical protein
MEIVTQKLSALAIPGPGEDTSSQWWLTLKMLRHFGFSANEMGKGIAIVIRGTNDGIIRDDDARIETFLYDAKNVRVLAGHNRDSLGTYSPHPGALAFSLELYCDRKSYSPIYGFVPRGNDPVQLAKNFLFALQELTAHTGVRQLMGFKTRLESGDVWQSSPQRTLEA